MNRRELLVHLRLHGCVLIREGGSHSIWGHPVTMRQTSVPRHREVLSYTAIQICRQLGIPDPPI